MGIPEDLFVNSPIHQEFICGICQEVFLNPVSVKRCEHIFCKTCIEDWIGHAGGHSNCPIDRQQIKGLKAIPRPFMNLYNSIQVRCKFHTSGCETIMDLGDMHGHPSLCEFNPEFKKVCRNDCGAVLMKKEIEGHNCVRFLKTIIEELKMNSEKLKEEVGLLKVANEELKLNQQKVLENEHKRMQLLIEKEQSGLTTKIKNSQLDFEKLAKEVDLLKSANKEIKLNQQKVLEDQHKRMQLLIEKEQRCLTTKIKNAQIDSEKLAKEVDWLKSANKETKLNQHKVLKDRHERMDFLTTRVIATEQALLKAKIEIFLMDHSTFLHPEVINEQVKELRDKVLQTIEGLKQLELTPNDELLKKAIIEYEYLQQALQPMPPTMRSDTISKYTEWLLSYRTGAEAKLSELNQELSRKYGGTFMSTIIYNYDSSQPNMKIEVDKVLCRIVFFMAFEGTEPVGLPGFVQLLGQQGNKQHGAAGQSKIVPRMGVYVFRI